MRQISPLGIFESETGWNVQNNFCPMTAYEEEKKKREPNFTKANFKKKCLQIHCRRITYLLPTYTP
jgi:hypothetical protein